MEQETNLFKNSEEKNLEDKNSVESLEKKIQSLQHQYETEVNNEEQQKKIVTELGDKWLTIVEKLNTKETKKDLETEVKISAYLTQAIKFGSAEALDYFLTAGFRSVLFFNIFLLALDNIPSHLQKNARQKFFDQVKNQSMASAGFILARYFEECAESGALNDIDKLHKINIKFLTSKLNKFSTLPPGELVFSKREPARFKGFKDDAEFMFQLIKFCRDRKFISQSYAEVYDEYFFNFALVYPKDYKKVSCNDELSQFISDICFKKNEIIQDIKFVKWVKQNGMEFSKWKTESQGAIQYWTQDEIFYWKAMKCLKVPPIELAEEVSEVTAIPYLAEALEYLNEISAKFNYPLNEDLLFLVRTIVNRGSLKYVKIALALIENFFNEATIKKKLGPELFKQFNDFYRYYSHSVNQFKHVIEIKINEITNCINLIVEEYNQYSARPLSFLFTITETLSGNSQFVAQISNIKEKISNLIGEFKIDELEAQYELTARIQQTHMLIEEITKILAKLEKIQKMLPTNKLSAGLAKSLNDFMADLRIIEQESRNAVTKLKLSPAKFNIHSAQSIPEDEVFLKSPPERTQNQVSKVDPMPHKIQNESFASLTELKEENSEEATYSRDLIDKAQNLKVIEEGPENNLIKQKASDQKEEEEENNNQGKILFS